MYTIREALMAVDQFHAARDQAEAQIRLSGKDRAWDEDNDGMAFRYLGDGDEPLCTVEFLDEDGTATVTFADGESETVTIPADQLRHRVSQE